MITSFQYMFSGRNGATRRISRTSCSRSWQAPARSPANSSRRPPRPRCTPGFGSRRHHQLQAPVHPSNNPSRDLVLSWLASPKRYNSPLRTIVRMSEKIPLDLAASAPVVRVQRCRGRVVGRLLVTAAAAGAFYYGMSWSKYCHGINVTA